MDDLSELIDFLNDYWERTEPTTVEEQAALYERAEDICAFVQEGGRPASMEL